MTRINLIPPSELCDQHLLAEWHEIPRVFTLAAKWHARSAELPSDLPQTFTLGRGHVRFFYTRIQWLAKRAVELEVELRHRGVKLDDEWLDSVIKQWRGNPVLWKDWRPTEADIALSRARIAERMPAKPRWTKRKEPQK